MQDILSHLKINQSSWIFFSVMLAVKLVISQLGYVFEIGEKNLKALNRMMQQPGLDLSIFLMWGNL